jgi:drug/metabolite transporter (DMT)-like permease
VDRRRVVGLSLIVISAAGFGSGTVLSKPIYGTGLDWVQLLAWRFTIGALLAWGWVLASSTRRRALGRLGRREILVSLGLGVWYTGNAGSYYASLETVPASLAGVLVYMYPVLVAVLSIWFVTRLPGRRPWVALAITLAGVVLTLGGIDLSANISVVGIGLVFTSALFYSGWIILSARLAGERSDRLADATAATDSVDDASAASPVMMTATAAVFVGAALATGRPYLPTQIPIDAWPFLLVIGFAGTFLSIQTFYAGSRRIGAAQAALVSTVEPLVIVVFAWIFLREVLAPIQLVGAALIVIGVLIAQTAERPRGAPEPASPLDAEVAGGSAANR